jgi:hypothetical protein
MAEGGNDPPVDVPLRPDRSLVASLPGQVFAADEHTDRY